MDTASIELVISHINEAKRDLENFPKTGLSKKSLAEINLAYNSLNDSINHCSSTRQNL